ncbi:hypothetical protein FOZ62_017077, partial [Perkinsus olseni]
VTTVDGVRYALVHFTGSGVFNRRMRYYAKTKLGLKVNDHGVFRSDGSCIPCKTEKDVFDCLHIKYIDPTLRESETALEILEDQVSRSYFSLIVLALSVMSPSAAVPFVSLYVFKYVFVEGEAVLAGPTKLALLIWRVEERRFTVSSCRV